MGLTAGCGLSGTFGKALFFLIYLPYIHICGPGSSVGIVTGYVLDGAGIESRWGQDLPPIQTSPRVHPASCTMGTGSFPGVEVAGAWG
jgi:hypothetical protein